MVGIKGVYQTKFGELWDKSLMGLMLEAGEGAINNAKIERKKLT